MASEQWRLKNKEHFKSLCRSLCSRQKAGLGAIRAITMCGLMSIWLLASIHVALSKRPGYNIKIFWKAPKRPRPFGIMHSFSMHYYNENFGTIASEICAEAKMPALLRGVAWWRQSFWPIVRLITDTYVADRGTIAIFGRLLINLRRFLSIYGILPALVDNAHAGIAISVESVLELSISDSNIVTEPILTGKDARFTFNITKA